MTSLKIIFGSLIFIFITVYFVEEHLKLNIRKNAQYYYRESLYATGLRKRPENEGFVGMIVLRNLGDQIFMIENNSSWNEIVTIIKFFSKVFLTMAMAAIGLSTNLKDIKSMGYKPFIVGFIGMLTVGVISIITIESYLKFFI